MMVSFLSEGQGPQGRASREWPLLEGPLWILHFNMEPGRMVLEKEHVMRTFLV